MSDNSFPPDLIQWCRQSRSHCWSPRCSAAVRRATPEIETHWPGNVAKAAWNKNSFGNAYHGTLRSKIGSDNTTNGIRNTESCTSIHFQKNLCICISIWVVKNTQRKRKEIFLFFIIYRKIDKKIIICLLQSTIEFLTLNPAQPVTDLLQRRGHLD